ncbi:MAG: hypothetical protein R8M45_03610 [Ghiorsea sp.]
MSKNTVFEFTTTIEVDDEEIDVCVEYEVSPAQQQTHFNPAFDVEVEILSVTNMNTDDEIFDLEDELEEHAWVAMLELTDDDIYA